MDEDLIVTYTTKFRGLRVFEHFIHPTEWKLRAEVVLNSDVSNDDMNTTFTKMNYFFSEIVSESLFFSADNRWAAKSLRKCANNMVLCPSDPADNMLAPLFQTKMNALSVDSIEFGMVELESDSGVGLSFMFAGDGASYLPTIQEWIGDDPYFADQPWWHRDDGSTMDALPRKGHDPKAIPDFVHDLAFLSAPHTEARPPAKIIRPEAFSPTIIRGSLDETRKD